MSFFDSLTHVTQDGSWFGRANADATLETLLAQLDAAGVARACVVGIAGHTDNGLIAEACAKHRERLVPIAGVDASALGQIRDSALRALKRDFRGIKLHPRLNGYDPLNAACEHALRAAGELGLPVFLDTLFRQPGIPTRHAADVIDQLSHRCPDTTIVLLHGGGPALLEVAEVVRVRPRLVLDLSFTLMRYGSSSVAADLEMVAWTLDQRTVVGSDFPMYGVGEVARRVDALLEALPPDKAQRIRSENLEALFPVAAQ